MSDIQFILGPWKVNTFPSGAFDVYARDTVICARNPFDHRAVQSIANGHLIAAAPELYEALDEAINYLAVWAATNCDEKAAALLSKCTAALEKADGES